MFMTKRRNAFQWHFSRIDGKDDQSTGQSGPQTNRGQIVTERFSVTSTVVESQSGYLEVGFEVPSGGAFRVIDVIVTEAPRFNPSANSR